jgi:hypothetical protein
MFEGEGAEWVVRSRGIGGRDKEMKCVTNSFEVAGGYHLRTDRSGRHRGYTFNLSRPRIGYGNGQGGAPTLMYCRVATPVVSRCKPYDAGLLGSPFRRWCLHVKSRYGVHPSEVFLDFSDARDVFSSDPQRLALPLVGDGA